MEDWQNWHGWQNWDGWQDWATQGSSGAAAWPHAVASVAVGGAASSTPTAAAKVASRAEAWSTPTAAAKAASSAAAWNTPKAVAQEPEVSAVADGGVEAATPSAAATTIGTEVSGGGDGVTVLDLRYFQNYKNFTSGYKQHNAALKWFRDSTENVASPVNSDPVVFGLEPAAVAAIVHPKGMDYDFDRQVMLEWSWLEMVAQLDRDSMKYVVEGDGGSRGIIGCEVAIRPGSYDHKRHHKWKTQNDTSRDKTCFPCWDFVIHREDGTGIRLHPNWSNPKVESFALEGFPQQQQPPAQGPGSSEGPGTYARYKMAGVTKVLKFDASKRPK